MLLLICRPCYSDYFHGNIQIHLTLLLITDGGACPPNIILIQIHLMLLLISLSIWKIALSIYSNTSHVTINRNFKGRLYQRGLIQIHLMLLLII